MTKVAGPPESVAAIGSIARRIRRFAEAVQQGHRFGIQPGDEREPWTLAFQHRAVPVYASTLPWNYLVGLASGFTDAADLMVEVSGPRTAATQWTRMEAYLRAASQAISESAPPSIDTSQRRASDLDDTTPPLMPFDQLAGLIHTEGASALRDIGEAIERCCDVVDDCPLTDQEIDWLRQLVAGARSVEVAGRSGYSERSFYRALSELWSRLGVRDRNEAIVLAISKGWVEAAA